MDRKKDFRIKPLSITKEVNQTKNAIDLVSISLYIYIGMVIVGMYRLHDVARVSLKAPGKITITSETLRTRSCLSEICSQAETQLLDSHQHTSTQSARMGLTKNAQKELQQTSPIFLLNKTRCRAFDSFPARGGARSCLQ
jgi:hypothetical protein